MGIRDIHYLSEVIKDGKRDKTKNTVEFNKKVKKRRAKEKHDAKARKKNQKT